MPATFEALAVVVLSIVPGFLALAAWSRGRAVQPPRSDARLVIHSVALSFVVQTFLAPMTLALLYPYREHLDQHPFRVIASAFVTAIAAPTLGGYVAGRIMEMLTRSAAISPSTPLRRFRAALRPESPTVFDWLVDTKVLPDPSVIHITYRDGCQLAGLHATGSCFATSPQLHGMFLPAEMALDDTGSPTGDAVERSRGLLIPNLDDVRFIRIIALDEVKP